MDKKVVKVGDVWQGGSIAFEVLYVGSNKVFARYPSNSERLLDIQNILSECKLLERDGVSVIHVPQGEALIGMLCGVSDISIDIAKEHSMGFKYVGLVTKYGDSKYLIDNKSYWRFAYPISAKNVKLWDGE